MTLRLGPCTFAFAFALAILVTALTGCGDGRGPESKLSSDWQGAAAPDGSRTYVIDWACEPKRFGGSAEVYVDQQEEYCEWRLVRKGAAGDVCQFTTSFDDHREFYLNSRGQTDINSVSAAQMLRDDCSSVALKRLKAGKGVGHNCAEISQHGGGCVPERNSDPEICDKVRFVVGEKYHRELDFSIDQMPPDNVEHTTMPLMRLGLLTALPKNCTFSQADHTEVNCSVPAGTSCFSLSGQLRVGVRVLTTLPKPALGEGPTAGK